MANPGDPEITDVIPQPWATIVVVLGTVAGLVTAFHSGLVGGPWYVKAPIGLTVGAVFGGLLLGILAGVRGRLAARGSPSPDEDGS